MQENPVKQRDSLQEYTRKTLVRLFPNVTIRVKDHTLKFKIKSLNSYDLDKLTEVEGRYESLLIRRSDIGLVLIFNFKPENYVTKKI